MLLESLLARLIGDSTVASVKSLRRRLTRSRPPAPADADGATERRWIVNDFGTGLGQATMAVREAVEAFERYGVLVDPQDWSLSDVLADPLREARRTVHEAEARLPRLHLTFNPLSNLGRPAAAAVDDLRESLQHLRAYYTQPSEGDDFSDVERDAARAALDRAREQQAAFTYAASRALR